MSLLCPSRGRPNDLERFILSVTDTATDPGRVEILVYVDDDDPLKFDYILKHKSLCLEGNVQSLMNLNVFFDEPLSTPLLNNILAEHAQGDVLMLANDDQVFCDKGWDNRLDEETAKYSDDIYCMWFNDGWYGEDICTFPIVSRRWVETLGYLTTPVFEKFNGDLWIWQIGQMVGRLHYIPDILVEHLHPDTGKAEADETTARNLRGRRPDRDRAMFAKFERYRILDAWLLKEAIENWSKD